MAMAETKTKRAPEIRIYEVFHADADYGRIYIGDIQAGTKVAAIEMAKVPGATRFTWNGSKLSADYARIKSERINRRARLARGQRAAA